MKHSMKRTWGRLPNWVQGFLIYVTFVIVVVGLPLSPALFTLLIVYLVR